MQDVARTHAVVVVLAVAATVAGCAGGSDGSAVVGLHTSATQVAELKAGASIPVNGILVTLRFRHTCIRDAAATICASLIPPGPKSPVASLPALNPGEAVSGVVIHGKFATDPTGLTWSYVTN